MLYLTVEKWDDALGTGTLVDAKRPDERVSVTREDLNPECEGRLVPGEIVEAWSIATSRTAPKHIFFQNEKRLEIGVFPLDRAKSTAPRQVPAPVFSKPLAIENLVGVEFLFQDGSLRSWLKNVDGDLENLLALALEKPVFRYTVIRKPIATRAEEPKKSVKAAKSVVGWTPISASSVLPTSSKNQPVHRCQAAVAVFASGAGPKEDQPETVEDVEKRIRIAQELARRRAEVPDDTPRRV